MTSAWPQLQLRRLAMSWDHKRVPLNAEQRFQRPGAVPYWGANRVQGHVDRALVNDEVVLLGEDGAPFFDRTRDVAFRVNEPIWPNNHIHVLKPVKTVDARWLAYALNDIDFSLYITGATRDKLTQAAMMRIQLAVPPTAQQRAIADYLDRETAQIDAFIAKNEELIALLGERRDAAIFAAVTKSLRGDPLSQTNVSWIGFRPEHWEVRPLRWSARIRTGTTPSGEGVFSDEPGAPWIRPDDLDVSGRPSTASRWLTPGGAQQSRPSASGATLLCTIGATLGKAGWTVAPTYFNQQITALSWPRHPRFLFYAMAAAKPAVVGLSVGNTLPILNNDKLATLQLPVPPDTEQREIVDYLDITVTRIDKAVDTARHSIDLARERRAALISAAVTGKIDVGVAA